VEVRNTLHSTQWLATTVVAKSATEAPAVVRTSSLRQYLLQSGRPVTSSLAAVIGPSRSLRSLILG